MYIGFLFLNTETRCLLNSVPTAAPCGVPSSPTTQGGARGHSRALAVDLRQPPAPRPRPPIQGSEVLLFSPISGYMCTRLIKYSTSPLLPRDLPSYGERVCMTATAATVSPGNRGGREGAPSLQLHSIQVPSSGPDKGIAGGRRPGPPPWAAVAAPVP